METPTRIIPATEPGIEPMRRLAPDEICPNQVETVTRIIEKDL